MSYAIVFCSCPDYEFCKNCQHLISKDCTIWRKKQHCTHPTMGTARFGSNLEVSACVFCGAMTEVIKP